MAPGVTEETAKVAGEVVKGLGGQPLMLALIVLNAIIIAGIYFAVVDERKAKNEIVKQLIANADKAQDLLAKCVVPGVRAEISQQVTTELKVERKDEISD